VTVNDADNTLTLIGTGFIASSSVTWNGTARTTTFVSSTQLSIKLVAADLMTAGTAQIAVANPTPGGGSSTATPVTIVYPMPEIESLLPNIVTVGGGDFTLTINGKGFVPSCVAQLNGTNRTTTFVSPSKITLALTAADISSTTIDQITVTTPAPGGGTSTPAPLAVNAYLTPVLSSVTPSTIPVGSPDTTASVFGTNLTPETTLQINSVNVPASLLTSNRLEFVVPATGVTTVTTLSITAQNPGTAVSNAVTITIPPNPQPTLTSLSPGGAAAGGTTLTLSLQGSGFVPNSVVRWNGSARPTTWINDSQMTAQITAADTAALGNSTVTVFNPAPGGGTSADATFTTYLALSTKDLIYDATRKLLWASVPSSAGSVLGNSVVSIDPYTGVMGAPIWVGSEPNKLALSDDGTTLWVSFMGTPSARKVDLIGRTATTVQPYFPGGWGSSIYAVDLAVMPGSPSTVAIAAGNLSIFDNATARPNSTNSGVGPLAFGANASTLYGFAGGLSIFSVNGNGIASTSNPPNSGTFSSELHYDNSRLYLTSGGVLDASNGNLLGTFSAGGSVAPDSNLGRAFVINGDIPFGTINQITSFDVNTFLPLSSMPVGGVLTDIGGANSLIRWGQDGLAFRTATQVYILRSKLVRDLGTTPSDITVSAAAPATSSTGVNTSLTISVKNNGPNSTSQVSLIDATPANTILVSANSSQGSCSGGPIVRCNLGDLSSGATATMTMVVVPTSAGTLSNTGSVTATSADPNAANNSATSSTSITGSGYNPIPALSALTPQSALAGSSSFSLSVNGAGFVNTSTVRWNGTNLPTTFVDATQLTATVDASLIAAAGSVDITVNNGTPGGGASGAQSFAIFQNLALDTNDIVFDPFTRKLYASVPSTATQVSGNSIVAIDPLTGVLGTPVFIGSEPTRMQISDDGLYLYVVLSGSNSVRRLNVTTMTAGTQFNTISSTFGTAYPASDVSPMPGNHDVVATVGYANGIQLYDVTTTGATPIPPTVTLINNVYEGSVLTWGSSTDLYSNDEGLSPSSFHRFKVGPTSFAETDSTYFDAVGNRIRFSRGLVFSDGGGVLDASPVAPATPRLVGRFAGAGGESTADANINRVFYLNQNFSSLDFRTISSFDAAHFSQVGEIKLDGIDGDAFDLTRWGADGLAFRTAVDFWGSGSGRVVLLHGPFVLPRSSTPNPSPIISSASPSSVTAHTGNTWVTITGSNFVPGSVVTWNEADRTTTFIDSTHLRVAIPASDLTAAQTVSVRVVSPAPGGGSSSVLNFTIN
jgi:uncharacterized repeat protein (TIGR01451 family)